jgi:Tol biopolymer transport system component
MDGNGKHAHPIPGVPSGSASPRWSPDGERIAFLVCDPSRTAALTEAPSGAVMAVPRCDVWIVDLGSGALTSLPVETAGAANAPAWFPRGDGIIIARLA